VGWDAYVDVCDNRYSVPDHLAGQVVTTRVDLDGVLFVYDGESLVVSHRLQPAEKGWSPCPSITPGCGARRWVSNNGR